MHFETLTTHHNESENALKTILKSLHGRTNSDAFTTFRLSRALKPSSKPFQFPNNGQYKAFYNIETILSAQKLAYVVPFCVLKILHVKDRTAPYLIFVTFIVTKKVVCSII